MKGNERVRLLHDDKWRGDPFVLTHDDPYRLSDAALAEHWREFQALDKAALANELGLDPEDELFVFVGWLDGRYGYVYLVVEGDDPWDPIVLDE